MPIKEDQKKEVSGLLNNISKGLKTLSIKELNTAIIQALNKKGDSHTEKFWLIDRVCIEYSIPRHTLMKSKERGDVSQAKMLAYCLLHEVLGLPMRHIAMRIFDKNTPVVHRAITYYRSLNLALPSDLEFKNKFDKINREFAEYIAKHK